MTTRIALQRNESSLIDNAEAENQIDEGNYNNTFIIHTETMLNFVETIQVCNLYKSRLLQKNEMKLEEVKQRSKHPMNWFFVNAKKINGTWLWYDTLENISIHFVV